jgi:hypothetical protein
VTRRRKGDGNCYEAAVTVMMEADAEMRPDMMLCHGTALGTGGDALGLRYGHAWVELGSKFVVDRSNGHDHVGPVKPYYAAGSIEDVVRYTFEQMAERLLDTRHYGPWHEDGAL